MNAAELLSFAERHPWWVTLWLSLLVAGLATGPFTLFRFHLNWKRRGSSDD